MSGIEVNINPEDVNKMVSEAILNSMLGEAVERAIRQEVDKFSLSYDNPVKDIVSSHVRGLIKKVLAEDKDGVLKSLVESALSKFLTDDAIGAIVQAAFVAVQEQAERDSEKFSY